MVEGQIESVRTDGSRARTKLSQVVLRRRSNRVVTNRSC